MIAKYLATTVFRRTRPLLAVAVGLGAMAIVPLGCAAERLDEEEVIATSEEASELTHVEATYAEAAPIVEAVESGGNELPPPTTYCLDWAPYRVSGTARFSNGQVVDGALIQIYKNGTIASWNLIGSGYTAADGTYYIEVGGDQPTYITYNYPIGGSYSGYGSRIQCNGQPLTYSWTRSFQAGSPSGYLTGRVTLDGANPPAGSKIVWSGATNGQVATAADGTYKTTNVFNGTYTVTAWAGNLASSTTAINVTTNRNTKDWPLVAPPLSVSITKSGSILTANASGGHPSYGYSWSYYSRCAGEEIDARDTMAPSLNGAQKSSSTSVSNLLTSSEPPNLEPCGYWWGPYQMNPTNQFTYHSCACRTYRVTVTDSSGAQAIGLYY